MPQIYSQHCFVANSNPKLLDLTLVCFLESQYIKAQFRNTKKAVLNLLVTVSPAWSASTFPQIVKPKPLGWGIFGGSSSFPSTCLNLLVVQSFLSKSEWIISGLLGSYTSSVLWYHFRCAKIWISCWRCPSCGKAMWDDNSKHSKHTSCYDHMVARLWLLLCTGYCPPMPRISLTPPHTCRIQHI